MRRTRTFLTIIFTSFLFLTEIIYAGDTGVTIMQQIYLARAMVPGLQSIGIIWNKNAPMPIASPAGIARSSSE